MSDPGWVIVEQEHAGNMCVHTLRCLGSTTLPVSFSVPATVASIPTISSLAQLALECDYARLALVLALPGESQSNSCLALTGPRRGAGGTIQRRGSNASMVSNDGSATPSRTESASSKQAPKSKSAKKREKQKAKKKVGGWRPWTLPMVALAWRVPSSLRALHIQASTTRRAMECARACCLCFWDGAHPYTICHAIHTLSSYPSPFLFALALSNAFLSPHTTSGGAANRRALDADADRFMCPSCSCSCTSTCPAPADMRLQADLCDAVAAGAGQYTPGVITDGEKSDNVARQLDIAGPACHPSTVPLPTHEEVVQAADEEGSQRFSAPATLLATWMKGVSNTISRSSTDAPSSGSPRDAATAQSAASAPASAKDLKRYCVLRVRVVSM